MACVYYGILIQYFVDTSRDPRTGERNGHHFHFVSATRMEREIMNGQMIEHGVVRGIYYATSRGAVKDVVNYGKTCVLIVEPQAIKSVRTADIQPFIVYFKAPPSAEMKSKWVEDNIINVRLVCELCMCFINTAFLGYF